MSLTECHILQIVNQPIPQLWDLTTIIIWPVITSGIFQQLPCILLFKINTLALTVTAERPPVGCHGAVTGKALPQLQTHSLVVAGVLCAGGAGACGV